MTVHRTNPEMWVGDIPGADESWPEKLGRLESITVTITGYWQPCAWEWLVDDWPGQIPADVETHSTHQLAVYTTGLDLHRILCATCNHEWPL